MVANATTPTEDIKVNDSIQRALARGHTVDITTTGRTSGEPRRIEIYFENIDGRIFICGMPNAERKRQWLRNLEVDPRMTFHLKRTVAADLPATARVIDDPAGRRPIIERFAATWKYPLAPMLAHSPLIEVVLSEGSLARA